jgi:hypothetical protein
MTQVSDVAPGPLVEVMALGLEEKSRITSFTHFSHIHLIFGTLLCHT